MTTKERRRTANAVDAPRTVEPTGIKAKARDILAAVRVLGQLDSERRQPTLDERRALLRFSGFGPVALSIFPDPVTGKQQGWVPVGEGPEDKRHREAFTGIEFQDGTYELVGPGVQGNPDGLIMNTLYRHGIVKLPDAPRDYESLREYLSGMDIEGIVWHHPDGRMVKIKTRDFGIKRQKA